MKVSKLIAGACCIFICQAVFAQEQQNGKEQTSRNETTVEDEYLSSVQDVIIGELAASDEYDFRISENSLSEESV